MLRLPRPDRPGGGAGEPASTDGAAVVALGLDKVYCAGAVMVEALRGVDLRIEPGELAAIMGPSGCGKTTLLNCLAGLENGFSGEVWLAGVRLRELSDERRARLRATTTGFIFQSFNLLSTLTVLENVEMPLLIAGVRGRAARDRALEMLDAVGLAGVAGNRPAMLSGGQQQRVAIARALANRPAIVFADEPTGNLDSESAAEVMALIRRLNRDHGQTLVIVTHAQEVARGTDRLIRMRDGRVVADGPVALEPAAGYLDPAADG